MSETKLAAQTRTEFGKGAARRLRRADQIPAVIYGHGSAPLHVALPNHETTLLLKHHSNALLELDVDGKDILAIAKEVQVEPVKNVIEHIDLIIVKRGEKIAVDVPVVVEGESAAGTTHLLDANTLSVEAEATHLPESIVVSIEGLEAGAKVTAADIELPTNVSLLSDGETLVVAVNEIHVAPAEGEEGESAEAAAAETVEA